MKLVSISILSRKTRKKYVVKSSSDEKSDKEGYTLQDFSSLVSHFFELFFYKLGYNIAKHPRVTIFVTVLITLLCSVGFYEMKTELDPLKLWVPANSEYIEQTKMVLDKIGHHFRAQNIIIVAKNDGNVLSPSVMKKLLKINNYVSNITITNDNGEILTMDDLCFKIPVVTDIFVRNERRRRSVTSNESLTHEKYENYVTADIDTEIFCELIADIPFTCARENILQMWSSNETQINNLTWKKIVEKINRLKFNPETGHPENFTKILGGIRYNKRGEILSAKSIISSWFLALNLSNIADPRNQNSAGTSKLATYEVLKYEEKLDEAFQKFKKEFDDDYFEVFYSVSRNFADISSKSMFQDIYKVVIGVTMMVFYMIFVLSKFGWIELRCPLAVVGLLNVGMAYFSGCGLASLMFPYSPFHTSLFFIIMGLGVDDIFVISTCLKKTTANHKNLTLPEKFGKTLAKAGTSITITSLTDIIAFLVGATTMLPSLQSFCIFAALCIFINYVFVVTFFVACLVIDEKRISQNRNGLFPWVKHEVNRVWCEPKIMEKLIRFIYSKFVLTRFGKVLIVLAALAISGFSVHRVIKIEQKFDPNWFIPTHSTLHEYNVALDKHYPGRRGAHAGLFFIDINYEQNFPKILNLISELRRLTHVLNIRGTPWFESFNDFANENYNGSQIDSEFPFNKALSNFLFSEAGAQYQYKMRFEHDLECGQPASKISMSFFNFRFLNQIKGYKAQKYAKNAVDKLIKNANFDLGDGRIFVWGEEIGDWVTDETVAKEVYPNVVLVLLGVFCCTIIMIAKFEVCALIFLCVTMSLITLGGLMEWSGLTLDIITCFSLQLSVGLCIDFATHIGHTFLTTEGDGDTRALKTVETIGEAVWQGGISTMIAVSILSVSDTYIFQVFFKIFTFVVVSGIFYGTFFLPVLLSYFNPKPYFVSARKSEEEKQEKPKV